MRRTVLAILAAALGWMAPAAADGPTGVVVAPAAVVVPGGDLSALARNCRSSLAAFFNAPPASTWVYAFGRPRGVPTVALWAGGGQFICRSAGPDRLAIFPGEAMQIDPEGTLIAGGWPIR